MTDDNSFVSYSFDGSNGMDQLTTRLVGAKEKRMPQFITALAATLGSFAVGCVLGYSSPVSPELLNTNTTDNSTLNCGGEYKGLSEITESEISWFGSSVNIGALVGAPIGGYLIKNIGRKTTLIFTAIPFALGWLLISYAQSFAMLIAGRIFCGVCCGFLSLTVPNYIGEIASADIRGVLGSSIQLMVTLGILYVYTLGAYICWQWLAIACLVPAVVSSVWMFFCPESPSFLVAKTRNEDAHNALTYLRGKDYNIQTELLKLQDKAEEDRSNKASFADLMKPHVMKPLMISLTLMFFQQTSGVNAILFNLAAIFKSADSNLSTSASSILIALVQVVMTLVATLLMDRAGRKILLILSSGAMSLSLVAMGTYFYLDEQGNDLAKELNWLPLASLIIFISFFSIGYGPIPWLMMGELFSSDVRELAGSIATLFNWSMSFVVTLSFQAMRSAIHDSGVYWLFGGICGVNLVFCLLVVKETKGKTIDEITAMFGGSKAEATSRLKANGENIKNYGSYPSVHLE